MCLGQIGLMGDTRAAGELFRSRCLLLSPFHQSCSQGSFTRHLKCSSAGYPQHLSMGMVVFSSSELLGYLSKRQISVSLGFLSRSPAFPVCLQVLQGSSFSSAVQNWSLSHFVHPVVPLFCHRQGRSDINCVITQTWVIPALRLVQGGRKEN